MTSSATMLEFVMANPTGEIGRLREEELPVVRVIVPPDPSGRVFEDDLDPGDLVFDGKFPGLFDAVLKDVGIEIVLSGVQMPRMNALMERWVQTCRRKRARLVRRPTTPPGRPAPESPRRR